MTTVEPTVMTFVTNEHNEILLLRRKNTWFGENQFAVPGGLVDHTETPEIAAARELREETNLTVEPKDLYLFHTEHSAHQDRQFYSHYFHTTHFSGTLRNREPHRHTELDWHPLEQLPDDTMPMIRSLVEQLPI